MEPDNFDVFITQLLLCKASSHVLLKPSSNELFSIVIIFTGVICFLLLENRNRNHFL